MDLRIVKTKIVIREAFLKLRAKSSLEGVKVTELCKTALINKTTFYKHYRDVYALSEEIEDQTLASILDGFDRIDALFSDPYGFVTGLYRAFKPNEAIIKTLFADGRMNLLLDKIEKRLKKHYPEIKGSPEKELMLTFMLRGASHLLMAPSKYKDAVLLETVAGMAKKMVALID